MQIFRGAITADQVKVLYGGNSQTVLGATSVSSVGVVDRSSAGEYCVPGDSTSCSAPIGYWKFDENTGTTAYDSSGNGNNGSRLFGTLRYVPGKIGSAFLTQNADGTKDTVLVGDIASLDFTNAQNFTIGAWVKHVAKENSSYFIYYKGAEANTNAGYNFGVDGSTKYYCNYTDGNGSGMETIASTTTADSNWHYVSCVMDRTGTATGTIGFHMFFDGKLEASDTTLTEGSSVSTNDIQIGETDASYEMTVGLDELKIYNYARTPAQIAWDMNQGKPLAWWKMDECRGTSVNDSMGNVAVGTISFGATGNTAVGTCGSGTATEMWNDGTTGKRNSGWIDSTDDAVSFGADSRLYLTTGGSIAAWIKPNSTGKTPLERLSIKSSDTSGTGGYGFQMDSGSNQFYGEIAGSTCISNPNAITMSTWNHVVWTFDLQIGSCTAMEY